MSGDVNCRTVVWRYQRGGENPYTQDPLDGSRGLRAVRYPLVGSQKWPRKLLKRELDTRT